MSGVPKSGAGVEAPDEREVAEDKERERWAREVLNLIREAQLPFLQSTGATTGATVEHRCCLGLRARTLAKRVRDWRPFRRFLLGAKFGTVLDDGGIRPCVFRGPRERRGCE